MKKTAVILSIAMLLFSCKKPQSIHVANADCAGCHNLEQRDWASSSDMHAASSEEVLTNVDHNTSELLNDNCIKCHSMFQYKLGVAHFVTPVDTIGSPAGQWHVLNTSQWQATRCEVCHNPVATNKSKLAKYGAMLDGEFSPGYIDVSSMPAAYQKTTDLITGDTLTYIFPDQTALNVQAMKLCNSCHDPADQGADPAVIINGINYGLQGGDSRVYVGANHRGFGCTDCHTVHTFKPIDPTTNQHCLLCHVDGKSGKVHLNHL